MSCTLGCTSRRQYGSSTAPTYGYRGAPQGQYGQARQPSGGWAWAEVRPAQTGFACRMPAQPRYNHRVGRDPDGAFYRTINARTQVPYGSFAVIVTEWEGGLVGDPLEAAASAANDIFSRERLGRRRSQTLDVPGFYGREDTGVAPNGLFVALRQFVGRNRIYVAVAIVQSAPAPLSTAESFMSSIRLDAGDALLPTGRGTEPTPLFLPETDFAVRMPPVTARRTEDVSFADRTITSHSFFSDAGATRFRVRVFEIGNSNMEPEMGARLARQLELGDPGAPVSASGFPGTSFRRRTGAADVYARVFVTAGRIYVLEVATRSDDPQSTVVRNFFDSFRIL